ncbi:MAG: FIST C-terminal domain-containing protein [Gammaproteobacteria bacterium]|nr:FIST C-terminal domain-containing protein [Gammaproteobacteria bacterium]MBU1775597.1 FIST C-terminal domain-containing protein [Gammaproteobacteria bacterium]MBU1967733.1 FIST C-terminal domain-containing protein [Gammaproteobacteria bacterium]
MDNDSRMRFIAKVDGTSLDEVLAAWQARHPAGGICALLPEASKDKVGDLQAACARHGLPLVGGIFPALIKDGEFVTEGAWLLCFEEMPWYALYENLPGGGAEAEQVVAKMAAEMRDQIDRISDITLFMLFDAMVPNIGSLLDSLYLQLANRVHYAGVNAGSETFQPMLCLFDGARLIQHGVLLMLLKQHKGAILEHGYHAPERTSYATSTSGNRISQIDWRPAFEVYRELVREQYGEEVTAENFYQYGVHFPFGIVRANHHVLVRIPVMLAEDGSLFCVGEVPPNSVLTLLKAPTVHTEETLQNLSEGLKKLNGDSAGSELLLFYCAGRRLHLGLEKATAELGAFATMTHAAQIAGALSLGEIGGSTLHGYPLFHNATLVASRW